ncbi:Uncharacterised protein [Pantoea agglomerans]|uniref:Uncharacterized protein n=1 Tax=Enterobacter agglomerans TaxID=549 RepID=A0A379AFH6_ENTAG|nr:Uncharacterised protein [Pantoea agglomerans]
MIMIIDESDAEGRRQCVPITPFCNVLALTGLCSAGMIFMERNLHHLQRLNSFDLHDLIVEVSIV